MLTFKVSFSLHTVHLWTASTAFSHITGLFFSPFFILSAYSTNNVFPGPAVVNTMRDFPHSVIIIEYFDWHCWLCVEKNMNIYSISISHGKNSSHITYIRLNHPWSINRLRTKALDWLREWLTAERVEPLNVKLKGKMGSVFVQVPWGEMPGFCTHIYSHTHTHVHTHTHLQHTYTHILWSCSTLGSAPH